jgi:hypothetical protein
MDHKQEFLNNLIQTYQENIWKDEINLMEFDEMLGALRIELAAIEETDGTRFKSANEARKARARKQSEIEASQAACDGVKDKIVRWTKQIELIKRYLELN